MAQRESKLKRAGSGFPSPAEDWLEPRLRLDDLIERPASTFLVRARGQAMAGDGIREGDVLVVDRSVTPRAGAVVVAYCRGEMLVRRLTIRAGVAWLTAPGGEPALEMDSEQGDILWGVVCYGIHAFDPEPAPSRALGRDNPS